MADLVEGVLTNEKGLHGNTVMDVCWHEERGEWVSRKIVGREDGSADRLSVEVNEGDQQALLEEVEL